MAKELLYTEKDKKLFLIVGYDNPMGVDDLIKTLENGKKKFLACLPKGTKVDIKTEMIEKSSRYQHMRVFFAEVESDLVPRDAFFIENKKDKQNPEGYWDMWKWLRS